MSELDAINKVLTQIQRIATETEALGVKVFDESKIDNTFSKVLATAMDKVDDLQQESGRLKEAYERGDNVNLAEVMVASQKASLSFQAMVQVRNRLIEAYKDIMNMPV